MVCKVLKFTLFFSFITVNIFAQRLQAGFDAKEYRELMLISARTTAEPTYFNNFTEPTNFKMIYQSKPIGLDNSWDLWTDNKNIAVISLRGTTAKPESWLSNFYAAMVPAKGELKINDNDVFQYQLAANSKAAVHVGWLLSMAYLSKEIIPKIDELYKNGTKEFLIMGHSQGGAIAFLLTSHLYNLQQVGKLPKDIRFKTYCSAGPKPGNLYYAYEYEAMTQGGWAYNVVNAADWVPEMPISIQTLKDFNNVNPFTNAKVLIKKQKFPANLVLKHVYRQLNNPSKKAQRNYEKYLGEMTSKIIRKNIPGYEPPLYYSSNHFVRTGNTVVLLPDDAYFKQFPDDSTKLFPHHFHAQYLLLLDKLTAVPVANSLASVIYTSTASEIKKAKENLRVITPKKVFIHSTLGFQVPDFSKLNGELAKNGFMGLKSTYLVRGGGFYTIFPRARLSTLFNYTTYSSNQTEGTTTNAVRGTTVGTSLGFVAVNTPKYQLIPFGGVVYSWFGARLSKNNPGNQSFSGYLAGGANQHHIATENFTGNVGLHFATTPFANKQLGKNLTVGLRSGYYIPFGKSTKWITNGNVLQGGPSVNTQGFYANLLVGIAI